MTAFATKPAALVECPKCIGAGRFARFAHIANGDCFLCGSAKVVDAATASRWLASQVESAPRVEEPVGVQTRDDQGRARKIVEIDGLGTCRILRYADGEMRIDLENFRIEWDNGETDCGGFWLHIVVEGGRVRIAIDSDDGRPIVCYGISCDKRIERHVLRCLQSALRR